MQKVIITFVIALLSLAAMAQDRRVAVFDPAGSVDKAIREIVREEISSIIVNAGGYTVLERQLIDRVLEENRFQASGLVDDSQVSEMGRRMGANLAFVTSITQLGNSIHISCKMIDVETARIEKQRTGQTQHGSNDLIDVLYKTASEMFEYSVKQPEKPVSQHVRETPATQHVAEQSVTNIRIEQRGELLYVTYDLPQQSDIEVFVSVNAGVTYRNRPLRHVSGAVGKRIMPGKNRVLIWNMSKEFGYYADFSNIAIRIAANAVMSDEIAVGTDISIDKPKNSGFYVGFVGGINTNNSDFTFGFNTVYFFNRRIGAGFAVRNIAYRKEDLWSSRYNWLDTDVRNIFFGPVFYGCLLKTRRDKFFVSTGAGLGGIYHSYIFDDSYSYIVNPDHNTTHLGYFLSGGLAYRPQKWFSIGVNCEYMSRFDQPQDNYGYSFSTWSSINAVSVNLGLNFHF